MSDIESRQVSDGDARPLVVPVSGDLDALTAPAFRRTLEDAARQSDGLLVVDMHDLRFMDSAGLAALVGVHRQLSPARSLALGNVPARMQRMLRVAAMSAVLPVHEEGDPWPWPNSVRLGAEEDAVQREG